MGGRLGLNESKYFFLIKLQHFNITVQATYVSEVEDNHKLEKSDVEKVGLVILLLLLFTVCKRACKISDQNAFMYNWINSKQALENIIVLAKLTKDQK